MTQTGHCQKTTQINNELIDYNAVSLFKIKVYNSVCDIYLSQDVIKTIVQSSGIKHLVTMATSEHVIMQNEALVALALIAALELGKYPSVKLIFSYFYLG